MAAAQRPPPVYVLNHDLLVGNSHAGEGGEGWANPNVNVGNGNLTGKAEEGWTNIEIARREAYGCGHNMRQALNGLSLCVRLGDDRLVTSTLGIRISRDARERFISELGLDVVDLDDDEGEVEVPALARIMMQEQDLLIIILLFEGKLRDLCYFLVYDRSDASLSMVGSPPDSLQVSAMFRPVPKRTSDGAYKLFQLACERDGRLPLASVPDSPPFLCVFSPVTGTNRTCAWETRRTLRWNVPVSVFQRFRMDKTFSFQGKAFWADLSQALIYCDLHTASDYDFRCIELPGECQLNLKEMLDCPLLMKKVTRTIACVGDSIWFVCIRRGKHHAADLVTMWTLELPGGQWKNEARFPVGELWRFDGFKEERLPETKVEYPLLTADGALCLVVTGQFFGYSYSDVSSEDHICTFDVRNKRLLWHGTVQDHSFTETVAFPPGFFPMKHPTHKRKFAELRPAAAQGLALLPKDNRPIKGQGEPGDRHQGKSRTSSAGSRFFVARLLLLARFMFLLLSFVLILLWMFKTPPFSLP